MRTILPWIVAALLFAVTPIFPRDGWWKASLVTLAATHTADVTTTSGKRELNPLLASDGRLKAKGIAIKYGMFGGVVAAEAKVDRKHRRWMTVLNFALAGVVAAVAVRNGRVRRVP
jgi:hypothetical protein